MATLIRLLIAVGSVSPVSAGPFPPAAGQPGSDALASSDPRFSVWASSCVVERGPTEIGYAESSFASFGMDDEATGAANATTDSPYPVVSLGDGGTATLEFSHPFGDAPGMDLAIFENSFVSTFLELAHVEVSSDGSNYFRFPSVSLTKSGSDLGEGGSVDPTNVHNLAGKYLAGYGTPFDLAELRHVSPLLDIQRITHVRVLDAVGTNDPDHATADSAGNKVIDPYPTPYFSSGFDLDAVGAFSPTTTTFTAWRAVQGIVDTDPAADSNHDGVPNLIEYLTGSGRLKPALSQEARSVHFTRLSYRIDGNLSLEGSSDFAQWTRLAESNDGATMTAVASGITVSESGNASKHISVTLPPATPYRFFRLAAEP